MSRSRKLSRRAGLAREPHPELDLSRIVGTARQIETRNGRDWVVQQIPVARAVKDYTCPGCGLVIPQGVAHLVAWRSDGILGDRADVESRRHWHAHCWRIEVR